MAKKKEVEVIQTVEEAMNSLLEGTNFAISTYSSILTNNRRIPTPIEALNCVFGGGVPFGLVANSYGRSKTGKSTWLYQMMALFQKEYPEGICFIIDTETSGDASRARHFGVDTDKVIICCPASIEEGFLAIKKMLENKHKNPRLKDVPIYGIWDSISNGLATNGSTQSRMNAQDRARVIKNYLGPLMVDIEKEEFFLGLVNQAVRQTDSYGNSKDVSGGGYALEHDVHLQSKFTAYKGDVNNGAFLIRRTSLMTIDKSKISPEIKNVPIIMDITEGGMIDVVSSFVEYMMDLGYLYNNGGWYRLEDLCNDYKMSPIYPIIKKYNKSYRYDELHNKVKDYPDFYNALRYIFMDKFSSIYKLQRTIIKPYMDKCLKEIRESFDSPELYMKDNHEKADEVINNIKNNPELLDKIKSTIEFSDAVCLSCGKDSDCLGICSCDNSVIVSKDTAISIIEEIESSNSEELEEVSE